MAPGAFSTPMTMPMSSAQTVSLDPTPPAIRAALAMMAQIRHLPQDEPYMRALGVDIIFQDGAQALQTLMARGCRIAYGDMGDSKAHAEWRAEENKVIINQKYQGDESPHMLRAISEALYHETGHVARQGDGQASLQEEINCLALNTLAHRYHMATVPGYAQSCSQSRLITDGVALYEKLFLTPTPASGRSLRASSRNTAISRPRRSIIASRFSLRACRWRIASCERFNTAGRAPLCPIIFRRLLHL